MPAQNAPHQIVVTIGTDGKMTSLVEGIEGPTCSELTKWLEELGVVEVDSPTGDFRKQPKQAILNRH